MSEEIQQLIATEQMGEKARAFIDSDIGRYLIGCGEQDRKSAIDEILKLDPYRFTTLIDLQNAIVSIKRNIDLYQQLQEYLVSAINSGDQAAQLLDTQETED